jgi:hypothetical protein
VNYVFNGEKRSFKANDKITLFYSNPKRFLSRESGFELSSRSNPGRTGRRDVPGRQGRVIYITRLGSFLSETVVTPHLGDYQTEQPEIITPLGTTNDFRTGNETGITIVDAAPQLFCTGNSQYIVETADYSNWDLSVRSENVFLPYHTGIQDGLAEVGFDERYGVNADMTIGEIEEHHTKLESNGYYTLPTQDEHDPVETDFLGSGKLRTAYGNNLANQSLRQCVQHVRDQDKALTASSQLLSSDFVGDDSIAFRSIMRPLWDARSYRRLNEIHVEVAQQNGFNLNFFKSSLSGRDAEHLKKRANSGGMLMRTLQLDWINGESVTPNVPPYSVASDFKAYMNTYVSRGYPMSLAVRLVTAYWILNRQIGVRAPSSEITHYVFPYHVLHTPRSLGGIGMVPGVLYGASVDAVIALYAALNPDFEKSVDASAHVLATTVTSVIDSIRNQAISGSITLENEAGGNVNFQAGFDFIDTYVLRKERKKEATRAQNKLVKRGLGVPTSMFFPNIGPATLARAISGSRAIQSAQFSHLSGQGEMYYTQSKTKPGSYIRSNYAWVTHIKPEVEDVLNADPRDVPMHPLDPLTRGLFRRYGFSFQKEKRTLTVADIAPIVYASDVGHLIDPDALFALLSDAVTSYDISAIYDSCIAVGLPKSTASKISLMYQNLSGSRLFNMNATSLSFYDQLLPQLAHKQSDVNRVVKIFGLETEQTKGLIGDLVMLYSICEYGRTGLARAYRIVLTNETYQGLLKDLHGRRGLSDSAKLINQFESNVSRNFRRRDDQEDTIL